MQGTTDYGLPAPCVPQVQFRVDIDNQVLCKKTLGSKDLEAFRNAVKQDFYFQARCSTPSWGSISVSVLRPPASELWYQPAMQQQQWEQQPMSQPQCDHSSCTGYTTCSPPACVTLPACRSLCRCIMMTYLCGGSSARWRRCSRRAHSSSSSSHTSTSTSRKQVGFLTPADNQCFISLTQTQAE